MVQHSNCLGKIPIIHTENNVQFVRALIDHADIDTRFTEGSENLTGNTGSVGHFPTDSGNHSDLIVDIQRIRLYLCLNLAQNGIHSLLFN